MEEEKEPKLQILPLDNPDDMRCITFVLLEQDHTLGNALRWMILQNPEVTFCGCSIPHPSEKKINLRIQTTGVAATEVLRKGLEDLKELCGHIKITFTGSAEEFKSNFPNGTGL